MIEAFAFLLFIFGIILCVFSKTSVLYAVIAGDFIFGLYAVIKGYSVKNVMRMLAQGAGKGVFIASVSALVGILTAIWRASGTTALLIEFGNRFISPQFFILQAFLITAFVAYATGSCIGSVSTIGVMFMIMARSGEVNPNILAGALLSAGYFGDRTSPISASANMIAKITDTDMKINVREMIRTGALPFIGCCLFYLLLSFIHPLSASTTAAFEGIATYYHLSMACFLPVVIILIAPMLGVKIRISIIISIIIAFAEAVFIQRQDTVEMLKALLFGFQPTSIDPTIRLMEGGGLLSMRFSCLTLIAACAYDGIFKETEILKSVEKPYTQIVKILGPFFGMIIVSVIASVVSCTQALAILMTDSITRKQNMSAGFNDTDHAIGLENTVVTIAALIPWNVSASVNLTAVNAANSAILYAPFLYLIPLLNWIGYQKRKTLRIRK